MANGADTLLFTSSSNDPTVAYGEAIESTPNPIELIDNFSDLNWDDSFWSEWLFPSGIATNGFPPNLPLNDPAAAANQTSSGIAPSALDQEVAEVAHSRQSLFDIITSIFPLPYTRPSKNTWPFGSADNAEPLQSIPQLGASIQSPESYYFHLPALTDTTFGNILQAIKIPMTYPPWPALSLEGFATSLDLDECIDLYFANFHPVRVFNVGSPRHIRRANVNTVLPVHSSTKFRR